MIGHELHIYQLKSDASSDNANVDVSSKALTKAVRVLVSIPADISAKMLGTKPFALTLSTSTAFITPDRKLSSQEMSTTTATVAHTSGDMFSSNSKFPLLDNQTIAKSMRDENLMITSNHILSRPPMTSRENRNALSFVTHISTILVIIC